MSDDEGGLREYFINNKDLWAIFSVLMIPTTIFNVFQNYFPTEVKELITFIWFFFFVISLIIFFLIFTDKRTYSFTVGIFRIIIMLPLMFVLFLFISEILFLNDFSVVLNYLISLFKNPTIWIGVILLTIFYIYQKIKSNEKTQKKDLNSNPLKKVSVAKEKKIEKKDLTNVIRFYFGLCITISILLLGLFEKSEILEKATDGENVKLAFDLYPVFIVGLLGALILFEIVSYFKILTNQGRILIYLLVIILCYIFTISGLFFDNLIIFALFIVSIVFSGAFISVLVLDIFLDIIFKKNEKTK